MTCSMTGFGKAVCDVDGRAIAVELSAVNHRYLECSVRVPSAWAALEPVLKKMVRKHATRGKINVNVNRRRSTNTTAQTVRFDSAIAEQYVTASKALAELLGSGEVLPLGVLAQMEGVFYQEEEEDNLEAIESAVVSTLKEALGKLNAMRRTEGAALEDDVRHRLGLIREALAVIEERLPTLTELYEARLRERIDQLKADLALTEERIAIEVAMMAEKSDVTEEVVRLKTHLDHMEETLASKDPVGRRLDFLSQEIMREVNTLGVKTRDADVAKHVLGMKAELEKIREQIQNIE
jgi:uncharacterized protein (TIGR00255 family)